MIIILPALIDVFVLETHAIGQALSAHIFNFADESIALHEFGGSALYGFLNGRRLPR